jgi:hypothetical protein
MVKSGRDSSCHQGLQGIDVHLAQNRPGRSAARYAWEYFMHACRMVGWCDLDPLDGGLERTDNEPNRRFQID